jgi:hypothetical protein
MLAPGWTRGTILTKGYFLLITKHHIKRRVCMKKNFILKAMLIIILFVFLPFLSACPPPPPPLNPDGKVTTQIAQETPSPPLQPILEGEVKNSSSTLLEYVRVRYSDGFQTCSQLARKGWYSFELDNAGVKTVTYRKKGYKMERASVTFPTDNSNITRNVTLNGSDPQTEISGYVGIQKEGITVNLYQLGCVYTLVASMKTCLDGTYSFTSLEDGSDLPTGTYKVEPVCSGICTFVPSSIADIPVPHTPQSYDFNTAACGDGACP